jgi:hypothetical protein
VGAVVGFVVCVANALDLLAAAGTGQIEATVDGHFGTEGGDLLREAFVGLGAEAIDPEG